MQTVYQVYLHLTWVCVYEHCQCEQALAGADPTSLHFAGGSEPAQCDFWRRLIQGHCSLAEPRLKNPKFFRGAARPGPSWHASCRKTRQ